MINVLYLIYEDETTALQKLADAEANKINKQGGLGGNNVNIEIFEYSNLPGVDPQSSSASDGKAVKKYLEENEVHIVLHPDPQFVRYESNFINSSEILFFTECDPAYKFNAPNLLKLNRALLDNRSGLSFVANSLKSSKVLFIQLSNFLNEEVLSRYEESLKNGGFQGDIDFFGFSEEEEKTLYKEFKSTSENRNLDIIDSKLFPLLERLPSNGLLAFNHYLAEHIIRYVQEKFPRMSFEIFSTNWVSHPGVIWITDAYSSMSHMAEAKSFIRQENLDDKWLGNVASTLAELQFLACCQFALQNKLKEPLPAEALINEIPNALNKIDGLTNIFLGSGQPWSFKNNEQFSKEALIIKNSYLSELDKCEPILFEIQANAEGKASSVVYSYIDLIRVENIDVSEGFWVGLFELEINSIYMNPIKHIRFGNRSTTNDLWEVLEIRNTKDNDRFQVKYRITGAFDFEPDIKNFPFDSQKLEIHTALEQSAENAVLQPPITALVDREFEVKGWKIIDADTGVQRSKNFDRLGANLQTKVVIMERNVVQWTLRRQNIIPALRSFVPLFVLIFLSWYSSFYNVDDAKSAVTLNTTVFLAGVALYFSAEKPKGSQFTFIDRLFIYFYLAIGTFIISEFSVLLGEEWYRLAHLSWSIAIPILLTVVVISLIRNIILVRN